MKAAVFALISLVAGIAIGTYMTRREFTNETLPIDVLLIGTGNAVRASKPAYVGPKVVVLNGERHDFGKMDRHAHNRHVFKIRNDGDAPLTLHKGHTTCKCTVSQLDREALEPGETAEVALEWDAKTSEPLFEQSAEILTNDVRRPTIHLLVHGTVVDTIRPDRWEVAFNDISANDGGVAMVKLFAFRADEIKILKHTLTNAEQARYFEVSFDPLSPEELAKEPDATAGMLMTIKAKPGLPVGPIDQTISIVTNLNEAEPIDVRVLGDVASDIMLVGPKTISDRRIVSLGSVLRGKGVKHTVFLAVKGPYREETQLTITGTQPTDEFAASLGEPSRDNPRLVRYPLTIEIPENAAPVSRLSDGAYATIRVATTHPDVKEMTIHVRYVVKEE